MPFAIDRFNKLLRTANNSSLSNRERQQALSKADQMIRQEGKSADRLLGRAKKDLEKASSDFDRTFQKFSSQVDRAESLISDTLDRVTGSLSDDDHAAVNKIMEEQRVEALLRKLNSLPPVPKHDPGKSTYSPSIQPTKLDPLPDKKAPHAQPKSPTTQTHQEPRKSQSSKDSGSAAINRTSVSEKQRFAEIERKFSSLPPLPKGDPGIPKSKSASSPPMAPSKRTSASPVAKITDPLKIAQIERKKAEIKYKQDKNFKAYSSRMNEINKYLRKASDKLKASSKEKKFTPPSTWRPKR